MSEWGSDNGDKDDAASLGGSNAGSEEKREPVTYEPEYKAIDDENLYEDTINRGIEFDRYFDIPVNVSGTDPPKAIKAFKDMDLDPKLFENIEKCKWSRPTPIQTQSLPILAAKRDLMACAQTGSGKTGGFAIPIINQLLKDGCTSERKDDGDDDDERPKITPDALIVAPTRELVQQIQRDFVKLCKDTDIAAEYVVGGHAVKHQLCKLEDGCNILVATPGRLNDFVGKGKICLENLKFLVLDEADRMLDMGFKEILDNLAHKMPAKEDRTTMMFSATFPDKVQDLGKEMLKDDYLFCTVGIVGGATETVTQEVIKCEKREQFDKMQGMLQVAKDNGDRILIFVETKRQTDFTASKLCQNDFPATSIHGDRQQMEREEALRTFKSGETPVLVATNVAARGLDIPGVTHVINMEMPKDIDEYVHRIGRTGRCGNKGKATSFFDEERDAEMAPHLVKILSNAKQVVPDFLQELVGDGPSATAGGGGGKDDAEDDDDGW